MPATTIRVFFFLVLAVVSCWTVLARGQSPAVDPGDRAKAASADASGEPDEEPEKVDAPVTGEADPVKLDQAADAIVEATNAFRREHGLEAVERQDQLQQAAQEFAEFMSREDLYGHQADGHTPAQRAKAAGYEYCLVRENIAYRTDTRDNTASGLAEAFTTGWKESPEHRQNMLAEHVTDTAVAVATENGTTFYAVQMFGRPRSESIQVRVRNRTSSVAKLKIETDNGVDSFELPPQTIATFTRCLPSVLTLEDSEAQIRADQSVSLEVVAGEPKDPLRLEPQEEDSETAESTPSPSE